LATAVNYYRGYYCARKDFIQLHVRHKIELGEIHIGPPPVKEGETLSVNEEGRYVLEYKEVKS